MLEELEPEAHPHGNFRTAMAEWRDFLKRYSEDDGSSGLNRMLLVQLFSVLEAYLSDTVISLVHRNAAVLNAIVSWHAELKDEKVTLSAVAQNPNLLRDMLISKLRRTQFHRFDHVNGMLRAGLEHHLLPRGKDDRDLVVTSVKVRHGCVHRNGTDEDGRLIQNVTRQYLELLSRVFTEIAGRLEEAINGLEEPAAAVDGVSKSPNFFPPSSADLDIPFLDE